MVAPGHFAKSPADRRGIVAHTFAAPIQRQMHVRRKGTLAVVHRYVAVESSTLPRHSEGISTAVPAWRRSRSACPRRAGALRTGAKPGREPPVEAPLGLGPRGLAPGFGRATIRLAQGIGPRPPCQLGGAPHSLASGAEPAVGLRRSFAALAAEPERKTLFGGRPVVASLTRALILPIPVRHRREPQGRRPGHDPNNRPNDTPTHDSTIGPDCHRVAPGPVGRGPNGQAPGALQRDVPSPHPCAPQGEPAGARFWGDTPCPRATFSSEATG